MRALINNTTDPTPAQWTRKYLVTSTELGEGVTEAVTSDYNVIQGLELDSRFPVEPDDSSIVRDYIEDQRAEWTQRAGEAHTPTPKRAWPPWP
jgi:hypothetical protein